MKLPFRRKDAVEAVEPVDASGQDLSASEEPVPPEESKRVRFKISVQRVLSNRRKKKQAPEESPDHKLTSITVEPEPAVDLPQQIQASEPDSEAAPKKIKKKRGKKPKKEREPRTGKRRPVVLIAFGCGCILATGTIATVIILTGARNSQDRLATAASYTTSAKYEKAEKIYNELLDVDEGMVDAHLGLADNYLAQGDTESAIKILQIGYDATGDATIGARLEELQDDGEPAAPRPEPIVWKDSTLESMVRTAMGFSATEPISEEDLAGVRTLKIVGGTHVAVNPASDETIRNLNSTRGYTIDNQLYTERGGIRTLDDLAHFKSLRKVTICYKQVSDISGLAQLTDLETVGLYFNEITDISALASLSNLRYLYIYHNNISSIQPLAGLKSLRILHIQNNQISDVSALKDATGLVELSVANNQIRDISPLSTLNNLVFLFADNNQIQSLQVLEQLSRLTDVSFSGNPVTDYGPSRHIRNVNRRS